MVNADLKQLAKILSAYYSISDLKSMCFDLGIDYEDVSGQGKSGKARELVLFAQRRGRLDDIVAYVQETRPQVQLQTSNTPPKPMADTTKESPRIVQEIHYHAPVYQGNGGIMENKTDNSTTTDNSIRIEGGFTGDFVQGDKVQGDKVQGDKITVGNISHSSGIAIGREAVATVGTEPKTKDEFKSQLDELKALLEEAVANNEFDNPRRGKTAVSNLNSVIEEAAAEKPDKEWMQEQLDTVATTLNKATKVTTAAGKVGIAVLKATPIIAGLIKAATILF